ncbi:hypothetical protein [Clostridium estertheticum]|uniref:hypothetical protein n=1 Tax=Clostridium estertheticum TaxID=238834 RepID=UPI001C0DBE2F|nr:hypothetical protein [Clostridium estertheticum]MBU3187799.1 hypothetical protein [Clostridium estertheticum]
MIIDQLNLFVGGYFDNRKFVGKCFEHKPLFNKSIQTYTLSDVLKLKFVSEGIARWHTDNNENIEFNSLTYNDKVKIIIDYTSCNKASNLLYFGTEKEALNYKNDVIKQLDNIDNNSTYIATEKDEYGHFREVYVLL